VGGATAIIAEQAQQLRAYLLQTLAEPEATELELRLLSDSQFGGTFDSMVDVIIDQYLDDELSPDDRDRAERYFFKSSIRREELNFAVSIKVLTAEFLS
jgi:hypothetical protein